MGIINLEKAKKAFDNYVSNYNMADEKIKLKMVHTYHVMALSEQVGKEVFHDESRITLAMLIGLLHDIGRFEQVRLHNTFDDNIFPHSLYGIKVLFEENKIREFIESSQYDEIIYDAIKYHSGFELDESVIDSSALPFCKVIRDADKLDIFRVILEENMKTISTITKEQFVKDHISDDVYDDILAHKGILRSKRHTSIDVVVSFIGFVFDINYKWSFRYVLENDYIRKIVNDVEHVNTKTKNKLLSIQNIAEKYCKDKMQ